MKPDCELYKSIIQNQPVVLLKRFENVQQKTISTPNLAKKRELTIERSMTVEQQSKRKRCSHCIEIVMLKEDKEQLLGKVNQLEDQLNYLSTVVEEIVEQQANRNIETSDQEPALSNSFQTETVIDDTNIAIKRCTIS